MSTAACHPRLAYDCAQILSNHYPERLGKAFCALPGTAFQAAWKAIRGFLPINTVSKVKIINSKTKLRSYFEEIFSPDMTDWMLTEIELNKKKNITPDQRSFWLPPPAGVHDPRGSSEYTDKWLSNHPSGHRPHPNIVDNLERGLSSPAAIPVSGSSGDLDGSINSSEDEAELDDEKASDFLKQLPTEYQIPTDAGLLS
ncbi:unnamed protein product [Schistocephalus solidus]|nr:unnamed protein product [Schistocephalus solidus]